MPHSRIPWLYFHSYSCSVYESEREESGKLYIHRLHFVRILRSSLFSDFFCFLSSFNKVNSSWPLQFMLSLIRLPFRRYFNVNSYLSTHFEEIINYFNVTNINVASVSRCTSIVASTCYFPCLRNRFSWHKDFCKDF